MQLSVLVQIQIKKIQTKSPSPSSHDAGTGSMQDLSGQEGGCLAVTEGEKRKGTMGQVWEARWRSLWALTVFTWQHKEALQHFFFGTF